MATVYHEMDITDENEIPVVRLRQEFEKVNVMNNGIWVVHHED